jgi:hypothetical protein
MLRRLTAVRNLLCGGSMSTPTPPTGYPPSGWQPPPPQQPRKSWPARHKVWTSILAVVGVLVVLGVIGSVVGSPKSTGSSGTAATSTTAPAVSATSAAPPGSCVSGSVYTQVTGRKSLTSSLAASCRSLPLLAPSHGVQRGYKIAPPVMESIAKTEEGSGMVLVREIATPRPLTSDRPVPAQIPGPCRSQWTVKAAIV